MMSARVSPSLVAVWILASLIWLPAQEPATAVIAGRVIDEKNQPVRRAEVTATGDNRVTRAVTTDADGKFELVGLPPARYTVTAAKAGYPPMSYGTTRPYRTGRGVLLAAGARADDVVIHLSRGAAMMGTVYDEQGAPMPGVPVMAWQVRTTLAGTRTIDFSSFEPVTVETDDRGRYRVFGLAPGDWTLGTSWYYYGDPMDVRQPDVAEYRSVFAPSPTAPPPLPVDAPRFNYSPVFTPGTTDPLSADVLTLAAGEVRDGVDLTMRFEAKGRVEGKVVNPAGGTRPYGLTIARRGAVQALNISTVTGTRPDGTFTTAGLGAGPYRLLATTPRTTSPSEPQMYAVADVEVVPGQTMPVTLTLEPALTATVTMTFDGAIARPADLKRLTASLTATDGRGNNASAAADDAGQVRITGLLPGTYLLRATVPASGPSDGPQWRMRRATMDGQDIADRPFTIAPGTAPLISVVFSDVATELSGVLTDPEGRPQPDYFVVVFPEDEAGWVWPSRGVASARPDIKGRYVFRGLPSGRYLVAVTTDLVPQDLRDAATLKGLKPAGVAVEVTYDRPAVLNLRTAPERDR